jgi:FtsZ-interacting cell division protein ZipA
MDTWLIIVIIVAVLLLLALIALMASRGRDRKHEANRREAREIRRGAEVDRAGADKARAEADVEAAEARRKEAQARERAADADEKQRDARERHLEAARLDPDVDEKEAARQYDEEHARRHGGTSPGESGDVADRATGRDDRVEHYERTETPDTERERVYEQDDQGDVVRDEERQRPR